MTSQFFVTYRLKPTLAFEEFEDLAIKFENGYEFHCRGDLAWIGFQASTIGWEDKRSQGLSHMQTYLSALALLKEYPFGVEPIQWIEVGQEPKAYVLGRLPSEEPMAQAKVPKVNQDDFHKARTYVILAQISPFFRRAMIDYSVALGFPREAVVFVARALEAVEAHFRLNQRALSSSKTAQRARDIMKNALCLPGSELKEFYKIANDTTVARHAKKLSQLRAPTLDELRFCIVFCRGALDRFALYLWHENRDTLKQELPPLNNLNPKEEFERSNEGLQKALRSILPGELK